MASGDWRALGRTQWIVAGAATLAALVLVLLGHPDWPRLADRGAFERAETARQPVNPQCGTQELAAMKPSDRARAAAACARDASARIEDKETRWEAVRVAQAAEQTAIETFSQALVSLLSLIVLTFALFASVWGAFAALRAAQAADETLEHQRRTAEKELRPYVFVQNTIVERRKRTVHPMGVLPARREKDFTGRVSYDYRNSGATPAGNVRVAARAVVVRRGEQVDLTQVGDFWTIGPLGPKDTLSDDVEIENLPDGADIKHLTQDGEWEVHLLGRIEYADEFAEDRWTTFHCYIGGDVGYDRIMHTAKAGNNYR